MPVHVSNPLHKLLSLVVLIDPVSLVHNTKSGYGWTTAYYISSLEVLDSPKIKKSLFP